MTYDRYINAVSLQSTYKPSLSFVAGLRWSILIVKRLATTEVHPFALPRRDMS